MKIDRVEKTEGGYHVFFKDVDMVAYVHDEKEIKGLIKEGYIKQPKKSKK